MNNYDIFVDDALTCSVTAPNRDVARRVFIRRPTWFTVVRGKRIAMTLPDVTSHRVKARRTNHAGTTAETQD